MCSGSHFFETTSGTHDFVLMFTLVKNFILKRHLYGYGIQEYTADHGVDFSFHLT